MSKHFVTYFLHNALRRQHLLKPRPDPLGAFLMWMEFASEQASAMLSRFPSASAFPLDHRLFFFFHFAFLWKELCSHSGGGWRRPSGTYQRRQAVGVLPRGSPEPRVGIRTHPTKDEADCALSAHQPYGAEPASRVCIIIREIAFTLTYFAVVV